MAGSCRKMVELAVWFCRDANTGYDQGNRWDLPRFPDIKYPGETDCSALTYECALLAGFNVPSSGTRYTRTIDRDFRRAGFIRIPFASVGGKDGLVPCDVLYKDGHVAIWTGDRIAEAYGDEKGGIKGGKAGDQANETRLSPYRGGWTYVYRYPDNDILTPPPAWPNVEEGMEMGDIIAEGSNNVAQEFNQMRYSYRWIQHADGRLEAYVSDYFNGGNGAGYGKDYYLTKTLEFPSMQPWPVVDGEPQVIPAFVEPPMIPGVSVRGSSNLLNIQWTSVGKEKATFWVSGPAKQIPRFCIDVHLEGFWK